LAEMTLLCIKNG